MNEKVLIRKGLQNPDVRAFVKIMGALAYLPSDRARRRVLRYVVDRLDEEQEIEVDLKIEPARGGRQE